MQFRKIITANRHWSSKKNVIQKDIYFWD